MKTLSVLAFFCLIFCYEIYSLNIEDEIQCELDPVLINEIADHEATVKKIADFLINGSASGGVYSELGNFVDKFGSRITGSENLENSIDYMVNVLNEKHLDNVHTEEVTVPHWVRGNEFAELIHPRYKKMSILGLGYSVGTGPQGITAEALVVKSFEELKARASEAQGKIVVYNQDFISYGQTVIYRSKGASKAAEVGAVASLIRSITPFSINSPHTGMQSYDGNVTKIPTACITIEDAEMLWRMSTQNNGTKLIITLYMEAQNLPLTKSRNTVAEVAGETSPEQIVLVSGHIDSWDVGQGAMDDGAGAFISWYSLNVLKQLGLKPKRTVRAVLWTGEELGLIGAQAYYQRHRAEMDDFDLVMESDIGTFQPTGLSFSGSNDSLCILKEILQLLDFINASKIVTPSDGSDINVFEEVPQASLLNSNDHYFWFHHSEGDTLTVEDPSMLDLCTVVWSSVAFVVANITSMLPRMNSNTIDLSQSYNSFS